MDFGDSYAIQSWLISHTNQTESHHLVKTPTKNKTVNVAEQELTVAQRCAKAPRLILLR